MDSPVDTYQQRPGTTNYGEEYEHLIPALFALRAMSSLDVEDIWLASNAEDMGAFDDVIFNVKYKDGQTKVYVIQLKHKKACITAKTIFSNSGDYSMEKYHDSFEKISDESKINKHHILNGVKSEDITYIIYTIANLAETINKTIMHSLNLRLIKENIALKEELLLNTNLNNEISVYRFETDNRTCRFNKSFLSRFFLFVNQGNTNQVAELIQQHLISHFGNSDPNITLNFLDYIKQWARGDLEGNYKLKIAEIQSKMTELLLSNYLVEPKLFTQFKKADCWNKLVHCAEITIVDQYTDEMVSNIWSALSLLLYKYSDRKLKENVSWESPLGVKLKDLPQKFKKCLDTLILKQVDAKEHITLKYLYIVLWKSGLVPLVLKAKDLQDATNIISALKVSNCNHKRRFVVLFKGERSCLNELIKNHVVIQTLNDVSDDAMLQEILDNLEVSLQGRKPTQLSKIIDKNVNILKEITTEMLLKMLYQPLVIGKKYEDVPKIYISRSITKPLLNNEVLQSPNNAFIINGSVQEIKILTNSWRIIDKFNNFDDNNERPNIMVLEADRKLNPTERLQFAADRSLHYLRYQDGYLEWIDSLQSTSELAPYLLNPQISKNTSVNENEILQYFSRNINILCGSPGIGKSVMMKRLAQKYMEDYWVSTINLNRYSEHHRNVQISTAEEYFSKLDCTGDLPLSYKQFTNSIINILLKKKKVLFLIDGFDELSLEYTKSVIASVKSIKNRGCPIWITTRPVQRSFLEKNLNSLSLFLNPFTLDEQKEFLKSNLCLKKYYIDEFVNKLQDVMSNSFCTWDLGFLSIPLHLNMILEVFKDCRLDDLNKITTFSPIDLYEQFIDSKLKTNWQKMFGDIETCSSKRILRREFDWLKEWHAKASLLLFYPKQQLATIFDYSEIDDFLLNTRTGSENVGIITSVSESNIPTFSHRTFAEYLAAKFLSTKCGEEKIKPLLVDLFKEELTSVRRLFDTMLAKNRPLHLAILNNDLNTAYQLLEMRKEQSDLDFDLVGRTPLHLAAAWGTRHHFPQTNDLVANKIITTVFLKEKDHWVNQVNLQTSNLIEKVLGIEEYIRKPDTLLGWCASTYAIYSFSLDVLDVFYEKEQCEDTLKLLDTNSLIYYCIKYGYTHILSSLSWQSYICISHSDNLFHLAISAHKNRSEIIAILLEKYSPQMIKLHLQRINRKSQTPVCYAAIEGNLSIFRSLVKFKVGLNQIDIFTPTLLQLLVLHNNLECLKDLLKETTVDLNAKVRRLKDFSFKNPGHSALYFAINNNNLEIAKLLIENGANIYGKYENERTVLHVASINGYVDCIKELVKYGAAIDSVDDHGYTPLHFAVKNAKLDSVNCLLQLRADFNRSDDLGCTSLHNAVKHFKLDLIATHLDVHKKDTQGRTPLHYASQNVKIDQVKFLLSFKGHLDNWHHYDTTPRQQATEDDILFNIMYLIQCGADPNEGDDVGRTLLHYATEEQAIKIIECLMKSGADINKTDKNGQTPLLQATRNGSMNSINSIINFSPNLDQGDHFNVTPLHVAAEKGFNKCAKVLIKNGANVNVSTVNGCTPLFIAVQKNNKTLVKLLTQHKANVNKLSHDNFSGGNCSCVAGKCVVSNKTLTPLHVAVSNSKLEIVTCLLNSHVKINQTDNSGWTALHYAANAGRMDCLNDLLKCGAELHWQDNHGCTPIHLATKQNQPEALQVFLRAKCGKALNKINNESQTALHIASLEGYLDCVKILIANGADANICTVDGFTAMDLATNDVKLFFQQLQQ